MQLLNLAFLKFNFVCALPFDAAKIRFERLKETVKVLSLIRAIVLATA